jgi:hypothetical protein
MPEHTDEPDEIEAARSEMHTALKEQKRLIELARTEEHRVKPEVRPLLKLHLGIMQQRLDFIGIGLPQSAQSMLAFTHLITIVNNALLVAMEPSGGDKFQ